MSKEILSLIECVKQGQPVKVPAMTGKDFKVFMDGINANHSIEFVYSAVLSALLFLLCLSNTLTCF
ncbi:TPA: hypothetical protein ACQFL4_003314 [Proteus mirabilis]|uniref:hypothetical protein n=1 Tax=Proteus vulgaris TaxID=585 RepID=UPI0025402A0B|nr:hypothetical protein [Proteus vulgaris]WIF74519.1 hypothetical protein QN092_21405 [Proteus vulgaris]HEK1205916.1 hypothetical protein [Proteus mirabilis]